MKRISTLSLLFLIHSSQSFAPSNSEQVVVGLGKELVALQTDCQKLIKNCRRSKQELHNDLQRLKTGFVITGAASANRAYVWANTILFKINSSLNTIQKVYAHCTCAAATMGLSSELSELLVQVNQEFSELQGQHDHLVSQLEQLKSQAMAYRR